jgi:predicted ribosome quality control (RQC) complex YloA/Tae2 family protein
MNALLLAMFAAEARAEMIGSTLAAPLWYPPVLSVSFGPRANLVAVLESPGPFCFLSHDAPFEGARAPIRFSRLSGAEVTDVSMADNDRVLDIHVVTRNDRARVTLSIALFGSAASAWLRRDDTILEFVGPDATPRPNPKQPADGPGAAVAPPFYLIATARPGDAAPTPSRDAPDGAMALGPFESALDACGVLGVRVLDGAHETIIRRIARPARRKADSLRRLASNLEADIANAALHERERREAETLAAYQTRVPPGASEIELPDPYDPDQVMRIELEPSKPLRTQIEKRFKRATKMEKRVGHAIRRLDLVRREADDLDASLRLLETATSFTDALRLVEAMRAKFSIELEDRTPPIGGPRKRVQEKTYRELDLDAHWFVIVGRSNHENDEITFKVAAPTDLWFHAHGVPGSHVVLKARGGGEGPSARILERAASVAAHYSKARHSGLVPVIYTQRKYVRKFRGAAPGEVTCEREKMVMVPPILPEPTIE